MDLRFTSAADRRQFTCSQCSKVMKDRRQCEAEGFDNLKKPKAVDNQGLKFNFCPGKATWFPEIIELFEQCQLAIQAGIFPREGHFSDQPEMFVDVYPTFVERWEMRKYYRVWADVIDFTPKVLEAIARMFGSKKGKK